MSGGGPDAEAGCGCGHAGNDSTAGALCGLDWTGLEWMEVERAQGILQGLSELID